jgi:hypothetical protein
VWWVVEATTGLTEALAGVAAEARPLRRLSGREAAPGTTTTESRLLAAVRLWDCAVLGEAGRESLVAHHGALAAGRSAVSSRVEVDSAKEAATRGDRADGADDVGTTGGWSAA